MLGIYIYFSTYCFKPSSSVELRNQCKNKTPPFECCFVLSNGQDAKYAGEPPLVVKKNIFPIHCPKAMDDFIVNNEM
jgi:hypothetical protein